MPRIYKDLIVSEPDGKVRLTFRTRDGTAVLQDVSAEIASTVSQQGDAWGARAANELMRLSDDGVPYAVAPNFKEASRPAPLVPREKLTDSFAKLAAAARLVCTTASPTQNGIMSAADKKKLDALSSEGVFGQEF